MLARISLPVSVRVRLERLPHDYITYISHTLVHTLLFGACLVLTSNTSLAKLVLNILENVYIAIAQTWVRIYE